MEDKFSIAKFMSMELRKSKEILNYQKSRGKVEFLEKLYDPEADKFKVRVKVVCDYYPSESDETKIEEDSYRVGIEFDKFESFYDFLDHNLENAELGDCRFDGVDLKKYDINLCKDTFNSAQFKYGCLPSEYVHVCSFTASSKPG